MNHILTQHLEPVAKRYRLRQACIAFAICWLIAAIIGGGMLIANRFSGWYSTTMIPAALVGFALATLIAVVYLARRSVRRNRYLWLATKIEERFPDLDSGLVTAIEQQPNDRHAYSFLQQEVIRNAVYHDIQNSWKEMVPKWQVVLAPITTIVSLVACSLVVIGLVLFVVPPELDPNNTTFGNAVFSGTELEFTVEPGNTELEKGRSLLVLIRFKDRTPPNATLNYADAFGNSSSISMTKSLSDPVFAARIPSIDSTTDYYIQLESQRSEVYRANVFEYPRLNRADAKLDFPVYTKKESKVVQDFRRVSAVEGTQLSVTMVLNKSVETAQLVDRDDNVIDLVPNEADPTIMTARWRLDSTKRYDLKLVDSAGRENLVPPRFHVTVLPNEGPKIEMIAPKQDLQVSPLEEVDLVAKVWDDFGMQKAGLTIMIPGAQPVQRVLAENIEAQKDTVISYMMDFEKLGAKPDQLFTYFFWAEDIGPDGNPRRTSSDMYFAEVRPFEEIYRQGQAPNANQQQQRQQQNQQGQQNAQQAQKLAELQKQIINANWKLIRREGIRESVTAEFDKDVQLLVDSQKSARKQAEQLVQQVQNPDSAPIVDQVLKDMDESTHFLESALDSEDVSDLELAMAAQQEAYAGLLKLRAREHQVVSMQQQRQQQQQGGGGNNRQQQQMQQMQLQPDDNRYQAERMAEDKEDPQQREDRQVLNRLRELARRQTDLNKRIKELQSALESAESEEDRKEIEKQLKRLQEQQEQILRDAEELRDRMNQSENQQRMSEQSQQMERARENIRRANDALQKGETTRAAAEGSRAEQELNELKDEFRKRTAGQFNDRMRNMRQKAQELDREQKRIAEDIKELNGTNSEPQNKSLRQEDKSGDLDERIEKQLNEIKDLKQSMREVIEESEDIEPLLAQELYDTFRNSERKKPESALESTRRSLQQGWNRDAADREKGASDGIKQMREGIEKAAESVLGDETRALERANSQLNRLKGELKNEIKENDPKAFDNERQSSESRSQNRDGNPGDGKAPSKKGEGKDKDRESPNGNGKGKSSKEKDREGNAAGERKGEGKGKGKNRPDKNESARGKGKSDESKKSKNDKQGKGSGKQKGNPNSKSGGGGDGAPDNDRDSDQDPDQPRGQGNGRGQDEPRNDRPNRPRSLRDNQDRPQDGSGSGLPPINRWGADDRNLRPLTGEDFMDWSDRLRDVEEMVEDPELRAEAARIRDRAKAIRKEYQRHSKEPNWDLVRLSIFEPLQDLQMKIQDELIRKTNRKSKVPIDRDPVPNQFKDAVRKYYQNIGSGR